MNKLVIITLLGFLSLLGCIQENEGNECPEAEPCPELDCSQCELGGDECPDCPECVEKNCTEEIIEKTKYVCSDGLTTVKNESECFVGEEEVVEPKITNIIDNIYLLDSNTSEKPIGSAVVVGKTYAIIATDEEPFEEYVIFSVIVDGKIVDSAKATCPDYCVNEKKYYLPLMISEGDYNNIQIIVEDAGGAKGESIFYSFVNSESEAEYLAETCELEEEVEGYSCTENQLSSVYYGGTITTGWPEGTTITPFEVESDFIDLCYEMKVAASAAGISGGHFAQAGCYYPYNTCVSIVETKINQQTCTCNCTLSSSVTVSVETEVVLPNWLNYESGTNCKKNKWDTFLQNLKVHEEGHITLCVNELDVIKNAIDSPTMSAEGNTCQKACDNAAEKLYTEVDNRATAAVSEAGKKQDKYDNDTKHGKTQGAVLDCTGC